jgi:colanic acid/amylovoran biosynthesis protein
MSKSTFRVALLWHTFGHGNLGVDALARSSAAIIRRAAARLGVEVCFTTLGTGQPSHVRDLPPDVSVGPGPRLKPLLGGRSDFLRELRKAHLVVDIGEGDSWTDIYGSKRFMFLFGTKLAAIVLGKPLILAPQTIGPFEASTPRHLANWLMSKAKGVYTRDQLSTDYLQAQGVPIVASEYTDVAFRLPYTPRAGTPGRTQVGLNVSGLLYNGGYTGRNELGLVLNYREYTHQLIDALIRRKAEVHLVVHVNGIGPDDDRSPVSSLTELFPETRLAPMFENSSAAKSFLSGLDFVVAGRMHASIGAFSAGVPVVPVAYSRKFNGLFGTLKYPYFIDGKTVSAQEALAKTLSWYDARHELKSAVTHGQALAEVRLQAYEDQLVFVLGELSGKG